MPDPTANAAALRRAPRACGEPAGALFGRAASVNIKSQGHLRPFTSLVTTVQE